LLGCAVRGCGPLTDLPLPIARTRALGQPHSKIRQSPMTIPATRPSVLPNTALTMAAANGSNTCCRRRRASNPACPDLPSRQGTTTESLQLRATNLHALAPGNSTSPQLSPRREQHLHACRIHLGSTLPDRTANRCARNRAHNLTPHGLPAPRNDCCFGNAVVCRQPSTPR
jgi:hypothetical protein